MLRVHGMKVNRLTMGDLTNERETTMNKFMAYEVRLKQDLS